MSRDTISSVDFLSRMSPTDVVQVFDDYCQDNPRGVSRWRRWCQVCASDGIDSLEAVSVWGDTLRKWGAGRPQTLRRPETEATHSPPYLEEIHQEALAPVRVLQDVSLRTIDDLSPAQKAALDELWRVLCGTTCEGPAYGVGITKAAMLLTEGQIGPAFDSKVRKRLKLKRVENVSDWLEKLNGIRADLELFEGRYQIALEDLVPAKLRPLAVGRAYDVITWWLS